MPSRPSFAPRHLADGPLAGEGCAQLVRRVRHEAALRLEGALQPGEQLVEGRAELFQLVVGAVEG